MPFQLRLLIYFAKYVILSSNIKKYILRQFIPCSARSIMLYITEIGHGTDTVRDPPVLITYIIRSEWIFFRGKSHRSLLP